MSKFRHLVNAPVTLTGYGPVGPGEVIITDLDLSSSPNFELVEDEPVGGGTWSEPDIEIPLDPVVAKKSKKEAEPVVDAPAEAAPDVEA